MIRKVKQITGFLFLGGWVIGQIARMPGEFPLTLLDASVFLLIIINFNRADWSAILDKFKGIFLILFLSWVLALRLFTIQQALPGLVYLLRTLMYFLFIFKAEDLLAGVKKWIPLTVGIFVTLGLLQYFLIPDTRFLLRFGWDEHYYRLIGTVLDPNYMGAMVGMIMIYAIKREEGIGKKEEGEVWKRKNTWLAIASFTALVLTWSRASWVATFTALVIYFFCSRTTLNKALGIFGILGILGFGLWLVAPKPGGEGVNLLRASSILQRLDSWQEGLEVWKSHSLAGVGFNNYKVAQATQVTQVARANHAANAPSNSWILILATIGVFGIIGVIREIGAIGKIKKIRTYQQIILLVAIHSLFNNTLFFPPVLGLLALMVASSPSAGPEFDSRPDRSRPHR